MNDFTTLRKTFEFSLIIELITGPRRPTDISVGEDIAEPKLWFSIYSPLAIWKVLFASLGVA